MNKVLLAVISSRQEPWGEMINTSKRTWDSIQVDGMETVFYVGSPESPLTDRVVGFDVVDTMTSMGYKNLKFFEWALNSPWDIMVRINASTYVHKPRLMQYCQGFKPERLVKGALVMSDPNPWLWGGYNFLFSRDVIQNVVQNKDEWNHEQMEDVAISRMLQKLGYTLEGGIKATSINLESDHAVLDTAKALQTQPPVIDKSSNRWRLIETEGVGELFEDFSMIKDETNFLFRVKQDLRRHIDKWIMEQLYDKHFGHQA